MPSKEYQRLARARSRSGFVIAVASRSSLWLGKDHLLTVETSGYTEVYKRFYFRDIRSLIFVANRRGTILTGVLLMPVVICLVGLANSLFSLPRHEMASVVTWGIVSVLFVVVLLVHLALGQTCVCFLQTAVQTEELPSLSRLRRARRTLERIRPLMVGAQGEMSREEILARMRAALSASDNPPLSRETATPSAANDAAAPAAPD